MKECFRLSVTFHLKYHVGSFFHSFIPSFFNSAFYYIYLINYAVVDIETTGGHASQNRIIEIAIVVTDGTHVLETFESLVNPGIEIPRFISGLTGIDRSMVLNAPSFSEIAPTIYRLLKDAVFVAHSVNFDYSFVRNELHLNGFVFTPNKLCTVRMSRKIFPGYKHYSLGNICASLGIDLENRHRAMGDAHATFILLQKLIAVDKNNEIAKALKKNNAEQKYPPNVPKEQIENLPSVAGVYYFHDEHRKVIYVGKALNIRKRVNSHFTGNVKTPQRQGFLRDIHAVSYEPTGNELIALLHEATEIRTLWPKYNRAQKKPEKSYGIYSYTGLDGFVRLGIDGITKYNSHPLLRFDSLAEAHECLMGMVTQKSICLSRTSIKTTAEIKDSCGEDCSCRKGVKKYNRVVEDAVAEYLNEEKNYVVVGKGRSKKEVSFVMVKRGQYRGYGYTEKNQLSADILEARLKLAKHNHTAITAIESFTTRYESEYRKFAFE